MCFAINMYDCELTSCSQNKQAKPETHFGRRGMIKERTKQYRVLACKLRYRHRQNDNVALPDKSMKCWNTIKQVASTRLVQTCYISCHQSIKTRTCINDNSVEQSINTNVTLSALRPQ